MRPGRLEALRSHLAEDADPGKAGRALALALLTLLAATVAGLQGNASLEYQRSARIAEGIALEATGAGSSRVIQVGAAYGIYRRWFEELERSAWASSEAIKATSEGDKERLEALQRIGDEVAEWIEAQTPLLQPPLYDADAGISDFAAFEAETIVGPNAIAADRRAAELAVANEWQARASNFVTALTVIAVGLFFVGLASTVTVGRRFLAGLGVAFGVGAAMWAIAISLPPVHRIPAAAIEHLAASSVALARAPLLAGEAEPDAADLAWYRTAIDEATAAITADPDYDAAYQLRGGAQVLFGDELFLSGAETGDDPVELLRRGMDDYRRFLAAESEDYAAWWNLGWAAYLAGDYPASIEATNRALELAPGQFTLHLNLALALLGAGDEAASDRAVDTALDLAAADTSDTASWYLSQSDYDIGRLAELRPGEADALLEMQLRLREAQAALRSLGHPVPDAGAPSPDGVTVQAIDIGRYSGGEITAGATIGDGTHVPTTDAVGVRVVVDGDALVGRHVSARLWVNGLPRPEYTTDVVPDSASTSIDLLSPYGRAGFDLDPGDYTLDLYVDGARRFQSAWTVDPRPDRPAFTLAASGLVDRLTTDNFSCAADPPDAGATITRCTGRDGDREFFVNITADAQDRITFVDMTARTAGASDPPAAQGRRLFTYVVNLLYPDDLASRAVEWINDQGEAVNDLELGGSTLRVHGADETNRRLDIFAVWAEGTAAP